MFAKLSSQKSWLDQLSLAIVTILCAKGPDKHLPPELLEVLEVSIRGLGRGNMTVLVIFL
jgi:hypothetical protein